MRISAVLIVKNEAECIERCLKSLEGFDEIIVVDTGSTDGTQGLCRRYTDKVFEDFPWCDNFAAARNHANLKATGDWLYSIDADHWSNTSATIIRSEAERLEAAGFKVGLVDSISEKGFHHHWREVFWKNHEGIHWVGKIHECLSRSARTKTRISRFYGSSKTHSTDPDRNLRILRKSDVRLPRTQFYLGRELYERGSHEEAVLWFTKYLRTATWIPEKCEALLIRARCYWKMNRGNEARADTLECIRNNPDFKEALLFMGEIHYEPWRSKWRRLAEAATNEDVLFIRT